MVEGFSPRQGDIVADTDVVVVALSSFDAFSKTSPELINPLEILALFAFSEAAVLHERILSEHLIPEAVSRSESLPGFISGGLMQRIAPLMDYKTNHPDAFHEAVWARLESKFEPISDWPGADFTLSASMRRATWSDENRIDHMPWPIFGAVPGESVRRRHVIAEGYGHVSNMVRGQVTKLRGAGAPIPIHVPPIAAIVLERCGGKADRFLSETMSLREEFCDARKKLWTYQEVIANADDKTLTELSAAYKDSVEDVKAALSRISPTRTDSSLLMELWDAVAEVKTTSENGESKLAAGISLGALFSKGVRWFEFRRVKARARLLFDIYQKSMQIRNYGTLVCEVFKTDPALLRRAADAFEGIGAEVDRIAMINRASSWGDAAPRRLPDRNT